MVCVGAGDGDGTGDVFGAFVDVGACGGGRLAGLCGVVCGVCCDR